MLGGTEGNDSIYGDSGMDTLWGDGGNDYLNGGTEADDVFGGDGDDIIEDPFGEGDVLRGNDGNDVITAARGADLLFGDAGPGLHRARRRMRRRFSAAKAPTSSSAARARTSCSATRATTGSKAAAVSTPSPARTRSCSSTRRSSATTCCSARATKRTTTRSWATTSWARAPACSATKACSASTGALARATSHSGVNFDLAIPVFTTIPEDILRDRFDQVEGLSGWNYNDVLDGDDRGHKGGGSSAPDSTPTVLFTNHLLTQEGINRIDGFKAWFGGARQYDCSALATPFPGHDIAPGHDLPRRQHPHGRRRQRLAARPWRLTTCSTATPS